MIPRLYLDIETTGFQASYSELTVVGLCFEQGGRLDCVQLVGDEISKSRLKKLVPQSLPLYTYNGSRFDLPFIRQKLGIDFSSHSSHRDLMYDCWERNLRGGLKCVEEQLGIRRCLKGVDGYMAVQLWYDYRDNGNPSALAKLLAYNREDVCNLAVLRRKLSVK